MPETIIKDLTPTPIGRWSTALDTIRRLQGKSAYVFAPALTKSEVWSLRSSAKWREMSLYVRQYPPRAATETRVWLKGKRAGFARQQKN